MLDGLCHFPKEIIPNCMPLLLTNLYIMELDVFNADRFSNIPRKLCLEAKRIISLPLLPRS